MTYVVDLGAGCMICLRSSVLTVTMPANDYQDFQQLIGELGVPG